MDLIPSAVMGLWRGRRGRAGRAPGVPRGTGVGEPAGSALEQYLREPPSRVRRLIPAFEELYRELATVGPVRSVVNNAVADHGAVGALATGPSGGLEAGSPAGGAPDLRACAGACAYACAVIGPERRCRFCLFDRCGRTLHALHATDATDMEAWCDVVVRYAADAQRPPIDLVRGAAGRRGADAHRAAGGPPDEVAANRPWRRGISVAALERWLHALAEARLPVTVTCANGGFVQRTTGPLPAVHGDRGGWTLERGGFSLCVRADRIHAVERVQRPTAAGPTMALECLGRCGAVLLRIAGAGQTDAREAAVWRRIAAAVEPAD